MDRQQQHGNTEPARKGGGGPPNQQPQPKLGGGAAGATGAAMSTKQRLLLSPLALARTPPPRMSQPPSDVTKRVPLYATSTTPPPAAKLRHDLVAMQRRAASEKRADFLKRRGVDPAHAGVSTSIAAKERAAAPNGQERRLATTRECLQLVQKADAEAAAWRAAKSSLVTEPPAGITRDSSLAAETLSTLPPTPRDSSIAPTRESSLAPTEVAEDEEDKSDAGAGEYSDDGFESDDADTPAAKKPLPANHRPADEDPMADLVPALDLSFVDIPVADFIIVTHAIAHTRHIRRIVLEHANLSSAHIRLLADAIAKRGMPIEAVDIDDAVRAEAPVEMRKLERAIADANAAAAARRRTQRHRTAAHEASMQASRRSGAVKAGQQRDDAAARQRRDLFNEERSARDALMKKQRGEMALVRTSFKKIADAITIISRWRMRHANLVSGMRPCVAEEGDARTGFFEGEWSARVALIEAMHRHVADGVARREAIARHDTWAAYSISYELSKRAKATRVLTERYDRLRVIADDRAERAKIVEERWVAFKDMHGDHLARFDALRRQHQSKWQDGIRDNNDDDADDAMKDSPSGVGRRSGKHGAGGGGGGMREKMDEAHRNKVSMVMAQEVAQRQGISHHSEGEETHRRALLVSSFEAHGQLLRACRVLRLTKAAFLNAYRLAPRVELWMAADAPHAAAFASDGASSEVPEVACATGLCANVAMPTGWHAAVVATWRRWYAAHVGLEKATHDAKATLGKSVGKVRQWTDHRTQTAGAAAAELVAAVEEQIRMAEVQFDAASVLAVEQLKQDCPVENIAPGCAMLRACEQEDAEEADAAAPTPTKQQHQHKDASYDAAEVRKKEPRPDELFGALDAVATRKQAVRICTLSLQPPEGCSVTIDASTNTDAASATTTYTVTKEADGGRFVIELANSDDDRLFPFSEVSDALDVVFDGLRVVHPGEGRDEPFHVAVSVSLVFDDLDYDAAVASADALADDAKQPTLQTTPVSCDVDVSYCIMPSTVDIGGPEAASQKYSVRSNQTPPPPQPVTEAAKPVVDTEVLASGSDDDDEARAAVAPEHLLHPQFTFRPQPTLELHAQVQPLAAPDPTATILTPESHELILRHLSAHAAVAPEASSKPTMAGGASRSRRRSIVNLTVGSVSPALRPLTASPIEALTHPRTHHTLGLVSSPGCNEVLVTNVVLCWACAPCDDSDHLFVATALPHGLGEDNIAVDGHIIKRHGRRIATTALKRAVLPARGAGTAAVRGISLVVTFETNVTPFVISAVARRVAFRNTSPCPLVGTRRIMLRATYGQALEATREPLSAEGASPSPRRTFDRRPSLFGSPVRSRRLVSFAALNTSADQPLQAKAEIDDAAASTFMQQLLGGSGSDHAVGAPAIPVAHDASASSSSKRAGSPVTEAASFRRRKSTRMKVSFGASTADASLNPEASVRPVPQGEAWASVMPAELAINLDVVTDDAPASWAFASAAVGHDWFAPFPAAVVDSELAQLSRASDAARPSVVPVGADCTVSDPDTEYFIGGTFSASLDAATCHPLDTLVLAIPTLVTPADIGLPSDGGDDAAAATSIIPNGGTASLNREFLHFRQDDAEGPRTLWLGNAAIGVVQLTLADITPADAKTAALPGAPAKCTREVRVKLGAPDEPTASADSPPSPKVSDNGSTWSISLVNLLVRALGFSCLAASLSGETAGESAISLRLSIGKTASRATVYGTQAAVDDEHHCNSELTHTVRVRRHQALVALDTPVTISYLENSGDVPMLPSSLGIDRLLSVAAIQPTAADQPPASPSRGKHRWIGEGVAITAQVEGPDCESLDALKLDLPDDFVFRKAAAGDMDDLCPTAESTYDGLQARLAQERWVIAQAQAEGVVRALSGDVALVSTGKPRSLKAHVARQAHRAALRRQGQSVGGPRSTTAFEVWPAASSPSSGAMPAAYVVVQRGGALSLWFPDGSPPTPDFLVTVLASLRYANSDRNPQLLRKRVLVTLHHVGGSASHIPVTVSIDPVDDPMEIVAAYPTPPGLVYRPLTTEVEPWTRGQCKLVSRFREKSKDSFMLGKWFPETSHDLAALWASKGADKGFAGLNAQTRMTNTYEGTCFDVAGPAPAAPRRLDGQLPLFMPQHVTIDDPDTDFLDGGRLTLVCDFGWLPGSSITILSRDQQRIVAAMKPDDAVKGVTVDVDNDGVLRAFPEGNATNDDDDDTQDGVIIGKLTHRVTSAESFQGEKHSRGTKSKADAPLNDDDDDADEPAQRGATPATSEAPSTTDVCVASDAVVPVLEVAFAVHRGDPTDPFVVALDAVRQLVHSIAIHVGKDAAERLPAGSTKQRYSIVVADGSNPAPGKCSLDVELAPKLFALPMDESPNAASILQWRQLAAGLPEGQRPASIPANIALAYSTRSQTAATGGEPVFPTAVVNVNEREKLAEGSFVEVFVSSGHQGKDALGLKFAGTQFVSTSDGYLNCGRDGVFGRVFTMPQYIRVDVPAASKAATYRRLQQLLRCVHFKIDADSRDGGIVPGDRTLTVAIGEGKEDLFGRPEVTVSQHVVTVQDLPIRRE